jgi:hypothetical protein
MGNEQGKRAQLVQSTGHMVFHYDRSDHSYDDLFISGEAVLHWWTQHQTAVHDAFTVHAKP